MRMLFLFFILMCSQRSIAQEVVATAGCTYSNTVGSISFTIGESVAQTVSQGDITLTQGFHQSNITVSIINELKDLDFSITVFPNPTRDILILKLTKENVMGLQYILFDMNGKLLSQNNLEQKETSVPVELLAPGLYLLKVKEGNKELKTFKIIKQ